MKNLTKQQKTRKIIQIVVQILFLIFFIALIALGKVQLWIGVFGLGVLLSIFVGRLYCGWACPINTAMRPITWLKKKLRIKSIKIPEFLKKPWIRYAFLALFLATFVFTLVSGKRIPVLPIMFGLGIIVTLFFPPEFWHKYLCPYGTILSITSRKSKVAMSVDADSCNNCGLCSRVCPAEAVEKLQDQHYVHKNDCIICSKCVDNCRKGAVSYKIEEAIAPNLEHDSAPKNIEIIEPKTLEVISPNNIEVVEPNNIEIVETNNIEVVEPKKEE